MSKPIGIGSRFRILSGDYRGREGAIIGGVTERPEWWRLDLGEGEIVEVSPHDLATLQRLSDAPAEVDPLFAELAALDAARDRPHGQATDDATSADTWIGIASIELDAADVAVGDGGSDASYRAAMMRAAMYALAAVRCIDRAHGVST